MISEQMFKKLNLSDVTYAQYVSDYKKFKQLNLTSVLVGTHNASIGTSLLEKSIGSYSKIENLLEPNKDQELDPISFYIITGYKILSRRQDMDLKNNMENYIVNDDKNYALRCVECNDYMSVSNIQTRRGDESGKIIYECQSNPNHKKVKH